MENLKTVKLVKEQLDKMDIPSHVKQSAVMGVMMGAKPESVIKGLVTGINTAETEKAEITKPKPSIQAGYSEVERAIAEMMMENTGVSMMDSGGASNRAWQGNRGIEDFRKLKPLKVTVYKEGDVELSLNIFHFLTTFLAMDDESRELGDRLKEFEERDENRDLAHLALMEEFVEKELRPEEWEGHSFNSYNGEDILSQVLQGIFLKKNDDYPEILILQIHGGCDVRGGYTTPRVFKLNDFEYFSTAMTDVDAYCDCLKFYTDDCGYHWYEDEEAEAKRENGLPKCWVTKSKKRGAKDWEYKLVCKRCKKQVKFNARLDV